MAFRVDTGSVLRSPRRTSDGALRVDATLTRTGVFTYRDSKGNEFKEYRPPEEVFADESINSFEALPVTDDHPPVMVDSANVSQYKRGRSGDTIKRDGIHMVGALIVDDPKLIAKMESGKRDVSNGYECDLDMTPGVSPDGERYDAVQRNIRGNHIAIVDAGRAGTARVRMDGAAYQVSAPTSEAPSSGVNQQRAVRGDTMDLAQALAALHDTNVKLGAANEKISNESKRADAAEQRAKDAEAAKVKADASADSYKAQAETATKAKADAEAAAAKVKTDAAEAHAAAVKAQVALVTQAMSAGVTTVKVDGKDLSVLDAPARDIKLATIAKLDGAEVAADKRENDAYVDARFDLAIERGTKTKTAFDSLNTVINAPARTDVAPGNPNDDAEAKARRKMNADSRNEWQTTQTAAPSEVK